MLLRCCGALALGILLAGAHEPVGLAPLLVIGVCGYFVLLHGLRARAAMLVSLVFGIAYFFVLIAWMRAVGSDAWAALAGVSALFFVPLGAAVSILQRRTACWPLWAALAWVGTEALRSSWPFSGFPWGRLSYAVADTPWAAGLPWFGFTGVSLLIALTSSTLAWWLVRAGSRWQAARRSLDRRVGPGWPRGAVLGSGAIVGLTLFPVLVPFSLPVTGEARIAVVQGDVPGTGDDLLSVFRQVTEAQVSLTEELGARIADGRAEPVDLVLWPENSTAVDPFKDEITTTGIRAAVAAVQAPVLVGAMVDAPRPDQVLNQGIVWYPGTGAGDRYTKWHPVPFGEYIPWRSVFTRTFGRLREIPRDMVGGTRTSPLRVNDLRVADAICFDVAYDDGLHAQLRNGADLAVVQTSNAMFIHTSQISQQYEITRLRAQETGRYLAVAAVNGVSGVIGPDGTVLVEAKPRTQDVLETRVGLIQRRTPAVMLGDWTGRACVALTLIALTGIFLKGRRSRFGHRTVGSPRA